MARNISALAPALLSDLRVDAFYPETDKFSSFHSSRISGIMIFAILIIL